ncbi:RNA-directed DNA polymerase [Pseudomonas atacamensis]|uniref:RNA-directed DNA polymerase n=1 Tax=Pseudomonas atacamensis TaxID=2565368 RepID=A0AAQ2DDI4_9PSED|nr:RNA-directed DNA polymerase [Pseudomonas atacamensis]THF32269.1 RNA-directed DNA polymerase [Pseudomonas atacamensis]
MSVVASRYERLGPLLSLLSDEAVLAQAWKKTDAYIRRHNWYADILELEQISLLLPQTLGIWQQQISSGDHARANPMRLVPAPKNGKWHFPPKAEGGGWKFKPTPKADNSVQVEPELRPLAHVSIREQVMASAVMLCVADAVETLQGNTDPATYASKAHGRQQVCSYGNRLFCDWLNDSDGRQQARFRWGNGTTYSQFFVDYQRFLERPAEVCREALPTLLDERLFVVKLDLAKFYDCVSQPAVVTRLRGMYQSYASKFAIPYVASISESFWQAAEKILRWEWHENDVADREKLKLGLPQGLVASGFFANAYMHDFDQMIVGRLSQRIGIPIKVNGGTVPARLIDYCRYVDDMRLVVAIPNEAANSLALETIANDLSEWANLQLGWCFKDALNGLEVKKEKSEAIAWEDFAVQGSTSRFMRGVNGQISTAPDPATLLQATGSLDHLLWLADALDDVGDVDENPLALARISLPRADVRDDTVKRFAANRLRQVLRMRRSMADPELPAEDALANTEVSERQALDHEMEAIARKLVACWSRNPALASVLRCGLDIFPSADLLRPVLQALQLKLKPDANPAEREVSLFVLSDLLRAGAVETGMHRPESYPSSADVDGYRKELLQAALEIVADHQLPWYLHQQAALFLAVMQYPVLLPPADELISYNALHDALRLIPPFTADLSTALTAGLLILRITGQRDRFVIWLGTWLQTLSIKDANKLIDDIAMIEPKVLGELHAAWIGRGKVGWVKHVDRYLSPPQPQDYPVRLQDWRGGKRSLLAIVTHPDNPFVQENALLKLTAELLKATPLGILDNDGVSLEWLSVECADWNKIQDPATPITLSFKAPNKIVQPWNEKPSWCSDELAWAYRLGRLMRSAIVGENDFTTRFFPLRAEQFDRYRGIQSSWYKRRLGLMPLSRGLGEEPTPISPWLNELVMRLLQWPGLEINRNVVVGFPEVAVPADLLILVKARLADQGRLFGRQSNLPAYLLPIECANATSLAAFKVALVQSLMPRDADFSEADPLHWTEPYRARHRAHLAAMCRLIGQQLAAARFASRKASSQRKAHLDLIVFPELSIHPDDMWLLHRLSDSTGAVIFAGQTFVHHPYLKKPINRGVWLLRQESAAGRQIVCAYQGKEYGIPWEKKAGVAGHRPYQVIVEFKDARGLTARLTGAICYDATDLKLAADMRDITDGFVIAALNKDIGTFDTMATALQFHMYQPVMLTNTGQYGGSNAQAPFKAHHERQIAHVHGNNQAVVSIFEVDLLAFQSSRNEEQAKEKKAAPAGFRGRS